MIHQDALPHPKSMKKIKKTLDKKLIVWDNYNVRERGVKLWYYTYKNVMKIVLWLLD